MKTEGIDYMLSCNSKAYAFTHLLADIYTRLRCSSQPESYELCTPRVHSRKMFRSDMLYRLFDEIGFLSLSNISSCTTLRQYYKIILPRLRIPRLEKQRSLMHVHWHGTLCRKTFVTRLVPTASGVNSRHSCSA